MTSSASFIDLYIAVVMACKSAKNTDEMKHYISHILGMNEVDRLGSGMYLGPLSDDLQRKKRVI